MIDKIKFVSKQSVVVVSNFLIIANKIADNRLLDITAKTSEETPLIINDFTSSIKTETNVETACGAVDE